MKHSLEFNPRGFTFSNDKLFFIRPNSPGINVFQIEPLAYQRTITVEGMNDPCDIVAGENVLYVSECEDKLIHRIQLPEDTVSNWSVDSSKMKLSITKNRNVIAAGSDPAKIYEYTSGGVFVRQIGVEGMMKIHPNLIGLQHAIQLEGDKFLVCHSTTSLSRVCIIDNTGAVIKCYAGNEGPGT